MTARSQTSLPSGVRKALGLRAGDRISYEIEKDQVVIRKVAAEVEDPALAGFLDLLGGDIVRNKERVVFATEGFANCLEELTAGIEAALRKIIFVDVPQDPGRDVYRQGGTLGKHWFRVKFGNGRHRLFFRYRLSDHVLVFALGQRRAEPSDVREIHPRLRGVHETGGVPASTLVIPHDLA